MDLSEEYQHALSAVGVATLTALGGLEGAARFLHPPEMPRLRDWLRPYREDLGKAAAAYRAMAAPLPLAAFHKSFAEGVDLTERALDLFLCTSGPQQAILEVLASLRTYCRALEVFYGLHRFPPLSRYFVEPPFHNRLRELDPKPPEGVTVGLHHGGGERGADSRGGFCLYIPESYAAESELSLVIALHGGSGSGRDFLWSWLREARGRRFALLAPTAKGSTWSLGGRDVDSSALRAMIEFVASRWMIDRAHVLLTGLSDGATYALLEGLSEGAPYTHIAPVSGVLAPGNLVNGNLARARGRDIYLVHGRLDWMFPAETAETARDQLVEAGARLEFRLLEDLSHTYPREENDRILRWFDPRLALPSAVC
ncbi:MAG: phospholipase [Deltaproteobacteria bacterium]|nr:phospholipase [Deltaproteobacteria bacterium]